MQFNACIRVLFVFDLYTCRWMHAYVFFLFLISEKQNQHRYDGTQPCLYACSSMHAYAFFFVSDVCERSKVSHDNRTKPWKTTSAGIVSQRVGRAWIFFLKNRSASSSTYRTFCALVVGETCSSLFGLLFIRDESTRSLFSCKQNSCHRFCLSWVTGIYYSCNRYIDAEFAQCHGWKRLFSLPSRTVFFMLSYRGATFGKRPHLHVVFAGSHQERKKHRKACYAGPCLHPFFTWVSPGEYRKAIRMGCSKQQNISHRYVYRLACWKTWIESQSPERKELDLPSSIPRSGKAPAKDFTPSALWKKADGLELRSLILTSDKHI